VKQLTTAQKAVYDHLLDSLLRDHAIPSMREMAKHFGWAGSSAADRYLQALEAKGWITRTGKGKARSVRFVGVTLSADRTGGDWPDAGKP
jgi:SOS-response transcriptional repressor LexA